MIHHVSGRLVSKSPASAVVETAGLGYRLAIPMSTFEALPEVGAAVTLLTHLHVREDAMLLFGFATEDERSVFETMLGVSGVGPKLALAALSAMRPADLRRTVIDGDAAMLTRIPGVGRKTAERLIVELRDRMDRIDPGEASGISPTTVRSDALSALESLGFTRTAAEKALRSVERDNPDASSLEDLVRLALREG